MIFKYLDWVIKTAYLVDNKTHFGSEPSLGEHRSTPGGIVALFLTVWPFLLVGIISLLLPISNGAKTGLIAIDAFILLVACILLAIKILKRQKINATNFLNNQELATDPQNDHTNPEDNRLPNNQDIQIQKLK